MNGISLKEIETQARALAMKGSEVEAKIDEALASLRKGGGSLILALAGSNPISEKWLDPWIRAVRQLLALFFVDGKVDPLIEDALDPNERWLFMENAQQLRQLIGEGKPSILGIRTRLNSIAAIIAISLKRAKNSSKKKSQISGKNRLYIEIKNIELLRHASGKYDIGRVIRYCEEINSSYSHKNFMSVILLIRSLLNHIPPLFGFNNFESFVSNSEKSVKQVLSPLQDEVRKIADYYTHSMITASTPLPTIAVLEPYRSSLEFLLHRIAVVAANTSLQSN